MMRTDGQTIQMIILAIPAMALNPEEGKAK